MATVVYQEDVNDADETPQELKFKEIGDEFGGEGDGEEMMDYISKFLGVADDARETDNKDKEMTLLEGIRTYPKAVMWSVLLSSVLIMEGYDTLLLASFYAYPSFTKKYGHITDKGVYELSAKWQTGLSMCTNVGEIIGLQFAGLLADKYGYRKTLIGALISVIGFIFILFFADNVQTLAAGEILCGIPWGFFQTITISYASEVCPLVLRYYLTTYVNVCWVFGHLIGAGVLKGLNTNTTEWSYRIPFALQWMFPIPLILCIYLAPEGPFWLVRRNRYNDAKKSLMRLMSKTDKNPNSELVARMMVNKMKLTVENEIAFDAGISYWSCFRGVNARRSRIAIMTWVMQAWTGSTLVGYSTYFYEKAGLNPSNAFTFTIIQYALAVCGIMVAWVCSTRFGRFQIYFGGLIVQTILLFIIGALGCISNTNTNVSWAIGSLLLVFVFVYDSTVGPVTYSIVGEIPSSRVRTKTIVLARNFYNVAGICNAIWSPYMLNSTKWNWGAKTGFFWGGFCLVFLVWMWFEMPETKGRTYAELDVLFEKGVKARDFKNTEVDPFDVAALVQRLDKGQIEKIVDHRDGKDQEDSNSSED